MITQQECLKCKKIFFPKRTSAKFCSASCRAMWNKKKGITPDLSVNKSTEIVEIRAMFQEIFTQLKEIISLGSAKIITFKSEISPENIPKSGQIKYNYEQLLQMKLGCNSQDEWEEVRTIIKDSDNLSAAQSATLLRNY